MEKLARAVHAAHDAGLLHRDLKPGNVLLAADGTPKVADFGLAKSLEGEAAATRSGAGVGTPSYMAPEQASGNQRLTTAVDVYGLAAILYELLTGRPPFKGVTPLDTLHQVVSQDPVPPALLRPGLPGDLEAICLKGLAKDPADRYRTARALADDLACFLERAPVTAVKLGEREWHARCGRRAGYEILDLAGAAGMAVVYRARQVSLNRIVALKMILGLGPRVHERGASASPEQQPQREVGQAETDPRPTPTEYGFPDPERLALRWGAQMADRVVKAQPVPGRVASPVRPDPGEDREEYVRRWFRAEAEAVGRLRHPHIVQVYDFGEQYGLLYLSMEFMEGGSLAQQVRDGPWQPRRATQLLETLTRATHYAHEQGIVHRDLKPANVLLTRDGVPKIADFGLARWLDAPPDPEGSVMGTPSYMAPEQAAGNVSAIGPATDVYSLGATLYELLTGRPPFRGDWLGDTLERVRTRQPVPPAQLQPQVPRDLEAICLKCLRKDPAQRYPSALALAEDLGRFLAGRPVGARPVTLAGRVYRWGRRMLPGF